MENKKAFGEYIRQKRAEAGLTQKGFADRLFVTESAVSKWERGLSYPDITLVGGYLRDPANQRTRTADRQRGCGDAEP